MTGARLTEEELAVIEPIIGAYNTFARDEIGYAAARERAAAMMWRHREALLATARRCAELESTIEAMRENVAIGHGDPLVDPIARIAELEARVAELEKFVDLVNDELDHGLVDRDFIATAAREIRPEPMKESADE